MPFTVKELKSSGALVELNNIRRGIEKESLRISPEGLISQKPHPASLGSALTNPYLTTDFSESLLELITPVFDSPEDCLGFLNEIHSFVINGIEEELMWPFSMPPSIKDEDDILIGSYGSSNAGLMKAIYRRGLAKRYGKKMQAIAGIHYNFSLPERFFEILNLEDTKALKNETYLGMARNFKRLEWLYFYLYGASPAINKNFTSMDVSDFQNLNEEELIKPSSTTLRMGDLGYISKVQDELRISFNSLQEYIEGLKMALKKTHKAYENIGEFIDDERVQLNTSIIQIENEYYNTIRPKRVCPSGERPVNVLEHEGINYLEVRCVDLNPFSSLGIDKEEINFLDLMLILGLVQDSPPITDQELKEIKENHQRVINQGNDPETKLLKNGKEIKISELAKIEIEAMISLVSELGSEIEDRNSLSNSLNTQLKKINGEEQTLSQKIIAELKNKSFQELGVSLALTHKQALLNQKLEKQDLLLKAAKSSIEDQQKIELDDRQSFEDYLKAFLAKIS